MSRSNDPVPVEKRPQPVLAVLTHTLPPEAARGTRL
jgi:hypothetical protein